MDLTFFDFDNLRIQGRMHIVENMFQNVLNLVLILPDYTTRQKAADPAQTY